MRRATDIILIFQPLLGNSLKLLQYVHERVAPEAKIFQPLLGNSLKLLGAVTVGLIGADGVFQPLLGNSLKLLGLSNKYRQEG